MNPNIILSGVNPDLVGSFGRGLQTGAQQAGLERQGQINALFRDQGPQIMAGNQNALNALAQFDPNAALGVQGARQDMAATQQRMDILSREEERNIERFAMEKSAAEVAQARQRIEKGVASIVPLAMQGDLQGANMMLAEFGIAPVNSIEDLKMVIVQYDAANEILGRAMELNKGQSPQSPQGKLAADLQAGLITPEQYNAANQKTGMRVSQTPDGGFIFEQGPGVTGGSGGNLNEMQSKNAIFSTRARGALGVLDQVVDGAPLADQMQSRGNRLLEAVPLGIGREFQGAEYQVAAAAGQEYLQAILRKDTGAAITDTEQTLYGQLYLPQPGDTPEVLEYRRQARQRAVAAIEAGMTPEAMRAQELALAKQSGVNIFAGQQSTPVQSKNPYMGMTQEQFTQVDINALSPEEVDQLFEAMNQ